MLENSYTFYILNHRIQEKIFLMDIISYWRLDQLPLYLDSGVFQATLPSFFVTSPISFPTHRIIEIIMILG